MKNQLNLHNITETAIIIAKEAGALLREGFGQQIIVEAKSTAVDWVTQYDKAAEELITSRLQREFPEHGIIGEENGRTAGQSPYTWIVDPLDGTTNFAHGFPTFAVSLGLCEDDIPILGVVYDPMRDECFYASKNNGAFLLHAENTIPLHVSETETLINSLLATGFPYDRSISNRSIAALQKFLIQTHGIRRQGAAALDLVTVAAGRFDGYWEFNLKSWDVTAGIIIVQEAGGIVTDFAGNPATILPQMDLVVSNGRIHRQMLDILKTVRLS